MKASDTPLPPSALPVAAVLAVVVHEDRVLLVRRANPPDAGMWGFPGGKIDHGEAVEAAAIRELFEETAIRAQALGAFTALDAFDWSENGELRHHFVLIAVLCRWLSGTPQAGDDATEAAWWPISDLGSLDRVSLNVDKVALQARRLAAASTV
ncbi:NUDIX hydrolase [Microvirga flavescens]|uniref:NUDIX hydrolase n=1 Tax=Microvirga flavescens TaxID=2249811 RepID=UPI000DDB2BB8|nr:NUDIX hydrolase [Microvirga flavescens]